MHRANKNTETQKNKCAKATQTQEDNNQQKNTWRTCKHSWGAGTDVNGNV